MSERADLYRHDEDCEDFYCQHVEVAPAEALSVLLPGVDWEALRVALAWHPRGLGDLASTESQYRVLEAIEVSARRLLAVYDGKDG